MSLELLKKSLKEAPIVKKGEYHYVIHPITDGVPRIDPELLEEVVSEIKKLVELIYGSKPEDAIIGGADIDEDDYKKIVERVNRLVGLD